MKVYFTSDLHMEFWIKNGFSYQDFVNQILLPADVLVIVGDISRKSAMIKSALTCFSQNYAHVLWCPGNHDFESTNKSYYSYQKIYALKNNLSHIPNLHCLDGNVVQLGGKLFGGAMGCCDFSYAINRFDYTYYDMYIYWRSYYYDGKHWNIGTRELSDVIREEYEKLKLCVECQCDVIISHFGPYAHNIAEKFVNPHTGCYYFDGKELLKNMPANSIWAFGHTHDHFDTQLGQTRLIANAVGFPNEVRNYSLPKENFLIDI